MSLPDDCIDSLDFCACVSWLNHSTGADHRSRAFQITPSMALSLSLSQGGCHRRQARLLHSWPELLGGRARCVDTPYSSRRAHDLICTRTLKDWPDHNMRANHLPFRECAHDEAELHAVCVDALSVCAVSCGCISGPCGFQLAHLPRGCTNFSLIDHCPLERLLARHWLCKQTKVYESPHLSRVGGVVNRHAADADTGKLRRPTSPCVCPPVDGSFPASD